MLNFKTIEPSDLLSIGRKEIMDEITSDPGFAVQTICLLSQKFIDIYERYLIESNHIDTWKLCNLLLSLAGKYGADYEGKVLIAQKYSQQKMADVLHANRTTVARAVKELTNLGLLERVNNFYCVRDIEKLKKHMDYISKY
jgi:CRP/FNR family transcriptional regulator